MDADETVWKVRAPATVFAIALGFTVFRIWAASRTGLIPDEAYYWLWSQTPQLGYYDHPPMIAWWIWASTQVFGKSELAVRLLPTLSAAVDTVLVYAVSRELAVDRRTSLTAALFLNAMFMFGLNAAVATPDAPSVMFWLAALWSVARLRRTGELWLWPAVGLMAGLGCVSKYTNLFLGLGICIWFLLDRDFRARCSFKRIALGLGVALVTFTPVIVWNARHGWVSFAKQFGRIGEGKASALHLPEFLATQFGLINPLIACLAVFGAIAVLSKRGDVQRPVALFIVATSAPLIAYMLMHSFHDRVQGNWLLPVYPSLAILAALAVERGGTTISKMARLAPSIGVFSVSLVIAYMASPFAGILPLPTPADGALGWRAFAGTVQDAADKNEATWIGTADYGVTAELSYHLASEIPVTEVVDRMRYSLEQRAASIAAGAGMLVLRDRDLKPDQLSGCFASMTPVAFAQRRAGFRTLERYQLYKVEGAMPSMLSSGCPVVRKATRHAQTATAGAVDAQKTL